MSDVILLNVSGRCVGLICLRPVATYSLLGRLERKLILANQEPQDVGQDILIRRIRLTMPRLQPQITLVDRCATKRNRYQMIEFIISHPFASVLLLEHPALEWPGNRIGRPRRFRISWPAYGPVDVFLRNRGIDGPRRFRRREDVCTVERQYRIVQGFCEAGYGPTKLARPRSRAGDLGSGPRRSLVGRRPMKECDSDDRQAPQKCAGSQDRCASFARSASFQSPPGGGRMIARVRPLPVRLFRPRAIPSAAAFPCWEYITTWRT